MWGTLLLLLLVYNKIPYSMGVRDKEIREVRERYLETLKRNSTTSPSFTT